MMDSSTAIRQTCQISVGLRRLTNAQSAMLAGSMAVNIKAADLPVEDGRRSVHSS